jgi:6-pyruvoyltetrahydropterin/6-carboxytetrahydropterin synthase
MNHEIFATRKMQFCAGHRVLGHEGKCAMFHGHNYVVLCKAMLVPTRRDAFGRNLDALGRVIDFSVLKDKLGSWIDEHWDHAFITSSADAEAIRALEGVAHQRVFLLPSNPTAENLASYLLTTVAPQVLPSNIVLASVRVWETPNCYAEASIA